MSFASRWRALEREFANAAAVDGDVYLPNFAPSGPVDFILVGMEPSLGRWARTPAEAAARIASGFRNFMWSVEDFIVHHAVRSVLCAGGRTYHITDVSKGAMTVNKAQIDRRARYARWIALLDREVQLVARPNAQLVAIGRAVEKCLIGVDGARRCTSVLHYSPLASSARDTVVVGREAEFASFSNDLSLQDILDVADEVMREHSVPSSLAVEALKRVEKTTLSVSRKKLAFGYAVAFAAIRMRAGSPGG